VRDEDLGGRSVVEESALLVDQVDSVDQGRGDGDVDLGLCDDFSDRIIGWVEAGDLKLVLDFVRKLSHLLLFTVDEDHIFGLEMGEELHDAFRVGVSTETHVVDLHLHVDYFVVDSDFLLSAQDFVANGTRHAITRDNDCIFLISSPVFKGLKTESSMKHARSSKKDHRLLTLQTALFKLPHMAEIEHVLFDEGFLDLLIRPINEQFVVEVSLLSKST
jgi:hypothetical protein